jgi:penicillin-binding protein 1A
MLKKFIIFMWSSALFLVLGGTLFMYGTSKGMLGEMPDIVELENPKSEVASEIYSEDGVLLGKFFLKDRSNVSYAQISPHVFDALIATEDIRFEKHSGIDIRGLARAFYGMGSSGGASTITQQLAKNLFHEPDYSSLLRRVFQKFKEWVISVKLERAFTKDEIITLYLNTVQFSGSSWGIKSASKEFFNKDPRDLLVEEAAILVGVLKATTKYNPERNPQNATDRRNTVLGQMKKYRFVSQNEFDSLKQLPLLLNYVSNTHNDGLAPYFREYIRKELMVWAKDKGLNIYKDGLKIHTSINSRMQMYAEQAVRTHLKDLQQEFFKHWSGRNPWTSSKGIEIKEYPYTEARKTEKYRLLKLEHKDDTASIWKEMRTPVHMTLFSWNGDLDTMLSPLDSVKYYLHFLQTGFTAIDPHNGQVKAWVGGINHKYFQYDHVNASATRQVGSTFKPLFYSSALYLGSDPCTFLPRERTTFYLDNQQTWSPKNSDGSSGGFLNMPQALAKSDNLYTAQLMKSLGESGPRNVVDFVKRMGIDSAKLQAVYSICLGVCDISVIEMASAFTVFSNKGTWIEPTYLTRVEDKNGAIIEEFVPKKMNQVLSEEKAYTMFKFLEGGVNFGTGARLRSKYGIQGTVGGKTGTTQSNSDGWFMAVSKDLVAATWVGADSRAVRFRTTNLGQGANTALPIFALFMKKLLADKDMNFSLDPIEEPDEMSYPPMWICPSEYNPGRHRGGESELDI